MNRNNKKTTTESKRVASNVSIEPLQADEIRGLRIEYELYETIGGENLIASTPKGICFLAFGSSEKIIEELHRRYPGALFDKRSNTLHRRALTLLEGKPSDTSLPLHIRGTEFQTDVWKALLSVPKGKTTTYRSLAQSAGHPGAIRAVGTAIGMNPVSYLIPCHRVIRSDGKLGGYHWGIERKRAFLDLEQKTDHH
ncbi:MAG TPA: methylated-DNA--[protein]-cysteine S-methyltransferase [Porphyromonadaceae bacterium]|jgi:AraC family transcriptional regulator of adaptative response/methylated-DNA-[protein]-cysteine methyltransferase|nr:methylated-DNA--[protein]-cysteine S-methyltransferase [Porphyromonadaceae bacterium]HBX19157.1 methylated-DNA--[protein]-cysteine S-methyltransferase [Porphyromonadaceae bacterium]HCM21755.1 methylated-DNA--[protein]-cysteine S-methyltransferase [Porphyromonadaceae bacterium]